MKKTFFSIISFFLLIIVFSTSTYAQSCCRQNESSDCGVDYVCYPPRSGPGANPTEGSCSTAQGPDYRPLIHYCRPATSYNPDFEIPSTDDIPELSNFKFNYVSRLVHLGGLVSAFVPYLFAIAGILLFFYLVYGAFNIVSAMGEAGKIATGSKIITRALIGFAVLFTSYWIMEILELVFGLKIL